MSNAFRALQKIVIRRQRRNTLDLSDFSYRPGIVSAIADRFIGVQGLPARQLALRTKFCRKDKPIMDLGEREVPIREVVGYARVHETS